MRIARTRTCLSEPNQVRCLNLVREFRAPPTYSVSFSSVSPRARTGSARRPLTRERVLLKALALADEGGVESLTMRKLGEALGVEAMSLYNHVDGKDDVLRGILDVVLAEVEPAA